MNWHCTSEKSGLDPKNEGKIFNKKKEFAQYLGKFFYVIDIQLYK